MVTVVWKTVICVCKRIFCAFENGSWVAVKLFLEWYDR